MDTLFVPFLIFVMTILFNYTQNSKTILASLQHIFKVFEWMGSKKRNIFYAVAKWYQVCLELLVPDASILMFSP